MLEDDIAGKEDMLAMLPYDFGGAGEVLEVDLADTFAYSHFAALAFAEFPGFIDTEVENPAGEGGGQLLDGLANPVISGGTGGRDDAAVRDLAHARV